MKAISRRYWVQAVSPLFVVGLVTALVAGGIVAGAYSTTAQAQGEANAMAVDADPSTAAVDASVARPLDVEFDVGASITAAGTPYRGYNLFVQFDTSMLAWVDVPPRGLVYVNSDSHGMSFKVKAVLSGDIVMGGAAGQGDATTFTGHVALVRFKCIASGLTSLHLVSQADPPVSYTGTLGAGGAVIGTALADAQITCGEGAGPVSTPSPASPTLTPTQGDTPPTHTPTPTGPMPTPTPLPPGFEAVPLVAGCNPVSSTYPNGTPIQTIADAVGPAGNLVSLWEFDFGTWLAFSPQYPEDSDLTQADLLDVVFACVGGPGDFVRPDV